MKLKTAISVVFKAFALSLVLAVLLPSVVKLSHSFHHHKHQTCDEDRGHTTHFHQLDLDCEFYKFKLTEIHFFQSQDTAEQHDTVSLELASNYYISYHDNQQLIRFLRGPPRLV